MAVAVVAAAAGLALALRPAGPPGPATAVVGEPAPGFSTVDLEGRRVALSSFDGPVLVNFWASWCTPCREEFPMLASVHGRGVTVLGVVYRDSGDNARRFMEGQRAEWPGLLDPRQQIASAYGVSFRPGIPVTVALDADHVVRARHVGVLTRADLDRMVALVAR